MAYDESLAHRVRKMLAPVGDITERKMFGGLAFMLSGNMCCCIDKSNLVVRTGPHQYEDALEQLHARVFDFTGRPMRGFVYVEEEGLKDEAGLRDWVALSVKFAGSLPPK
ncbi:MAG: TfoX/Sxy family protein [Chloroflexi bacterium]|nr:TfoX/Sxy family protein [Chloroflexota bacterium]